MLPELPNGATGWVQLVVRQAVWHSDVLVGWDADAGSEATAPDEAPAAPASIRAEVAAAASQEAGRRSLVARCMARVSPMGEVGLRMR
jgi:Rod binding domain-containing protein